MRSKIVVGLVTTVLLLGACTSNKSRFAEQEKGDPAEVNTQLAIEYMREGMYQASMEKFKKALKQNPNLQVAHASLAILYERLGENKLAEKHYRKAYNLNRKDPLTLNNYGQFMCRDGRLKEADKMFAAAVRDPLYRHPETVYTMQGFVRRCVLIRNWRIPISVKPCRRTRSIHLRCARWLKAALQRKSILPHAPI